MTNKLIKSSSYGLVSIHLAVLLFGAAGLFGKLIHVSSTIIVFGRTFFAAVSLIILLIVFKERIRCHRKKDVLIFIFMGAILATHWVTFFHSIQISTVATGLLSFSSFPVFVTFLEPLFFNHKLRVMDIIISFIVVAGLLLILPEFNCSNNLTLGVFWGVISGFTFAVLTLLNRSYVSRYSALTLSLYQNGFACALLFPFTISMLPTVTLIESGQLMLLGTIFTAMAHTLFIHGMNNVKAHLASVIACLEPVYGILFSLLILQAFPSLREIIGGSILISAMIYATLHQTTATPIKKPYPPEE